MLDKWSPTSKLSEIKLFHYPDCRYIFFSLAREAACPPYLLNLFLISSNLFPCLLWLNFECWLTCQLCRFSRKSATATFCIIFPTFLRTGISSDFTWIFIDWLSAGFLPEVLSLWRKKKRHRKKSRQKMFLQTQSKISTLILFQGKMQFLPPQ